MNVNIVSNEIHYKEYEISINLSIEKNKFIDITWAIKDKNGEEIKKDCSSLSQAIFFIDNFTEDSKK